jgi:hypothetical protein
VANPEQVRDLLTVLKELVPEHSLTVALDPSGTNGDPVRQALTDAGLTVQRISPKAAMPIEIAKEAGSPFTGLAFPRPPFPAEKSRHLGQS